MNSTSFQAEQSITKDVAQRGSTRAFLAAFAQPPQDGYATIAATVTPGNTSAPSRLDSLSEPVKSSMPSNAQRQEATSVVYVIDDEEATRSSLKNLLRSVGFTVRSFEGTAAFKASEKNAGPSCMLLDIRLRGESGLFFQQQEKANQQMPIIFMTGFADVSICIKAMKSGATDFLLKPLSEQDVIDAVTAALAQDKKRLEAAYQRSNLTELYESLTSREREVLAYVVGGALNKQIAAGIGISEITVKVHRGTAMKKMKSSSVADLVRKAQMLGIEPMSR